MTVDTQGLKASDDDILAGIHRVGEMLIDDIDAIAAALIDKILELEPAYQPGQNITLDELTTTVKQTATGVFATIAGHPIESTWFEQNGRRRAASSIPLHAVLHAYRIGGLHHWECFARVASTLPLGERIITEGSTTVWSTIDLASQYVTHGYSDEIESLRRRSAATRAGLLRRLLEGKLAADVEVWDAASALSMPMNGTFILVAAPSMAADVDSIPDAERILTRLNMQSAWLSDSSIQVGLINVANVSRIGRAAEHLGSATGVPIGMSEPFEDISAAPEALRQARIAMAAGSGAGPGVTPYTDVPLQAMLVLAPQSAEHIRRAVLGPLLDAPHGDSAMLMETLDAWIRAGGSAAECARLMYLHRNSVTRRLQRIFELTGWDPQTPRGIAMLYVAAEAHRLARSPAGATLQSPATTS
ncbi:MAG: putative transcriptional regulator [Aeromicrobium sp.]|nr:putative transcriptional regulator [Aeromicrobium sp.]